jgi:membrane protease YdiL (CAAX protease family)
VAAALASLVISGIVYGVVAGSGPGTPPRATVAGAVALPLCMLGSATLIIKRFGRRPAAEILQLDRARVWADIGLGVAVGIGLQVAVVLLFRLLRVDTEQEVAKDIKALTGAQLAILVVAAGVLAPVAEELFFRVTLLLGLAWRLGLPAAVAVQGIVFGAAHITDRKTIPAGIALAFVGIVLGWIFARGRSILCLIAAHMTFNGFAVIGLLLDRSVHP